ncbi:MAG: type II toxin-antitoxin system prevent-host-death family antitoxin [Armatimonadetes bacterium]|nr:type II toxin-antitoxin system prevent-host-death family antitoxin [Armatimonadota bacterium]
MPQTYSAYEAKARFGEVIRKVRAGQRVVISYRGREVAEILPLHPRGRDLADRLERLEEEGVVSRAGSPAGRLEPLARKPGALTRFLESRE